MSRVGSASVLALSVVLPLALGMSGCAAPTMHLTPITESNRDLRYNGFSATAPVDTGWALTTPVRPPLTTGLGKKGASATNTLMMSIAVGSLPKLPPDQLFGMLEKAKEEELKTGRFQPRSFKAARERYREAECHRYDAEAEDRGVPQFKGTLFILEMHGLTCLHPDLSAAFVDIQYSQRRLATEQPVDMTAEGEAFIQSLEFSPLVRPFVSNAIEVRGTPQMVAVGHGSLWVTLIDQNAVVRVNPALTAIEATIVVGTAPVGLAVTDQAVWVANNGADTVSRIDPASNQVVATVAVGAKPLLLASAFDSVWVTNTGGGTVSRIDPNTNTVAATVTVGNQPSGVGTAGNAVWISNFKDNSVQRIDPANNRVQGKSVSVGKSPNFVTGDGSDLWVANQGDGTVYRMATATDTVTARIPIGSVLGGLSVGHGLLWVADYQRGNVARVDPQLGQVIGPTIPVGGAPLGVTTTRDAVYVVAAATGLLLRIEP